MAAALLLTAAVVRRTAWALTVLRRPDVFPEAIASAQVTDWRLYDTRYTERYLGHPKGGPRCTNATR